jgi:hypothetical protein
VVVHVLLGRTASAMQFLPPFAAGRLVIVVQVTVRVVGPLLTAGSHTGTHCGQTVVCTQSIGTRVEVHGFTTVDVAHAIGGF